MPEQLLSLGVAAPGEAALFDLDPEPLPPGGFRVDTVYTGLSAGTELAIFKGTDPHLHSSWDPERGVFRDGTPTRRLPVTVMGYMEVARVIESDTPAVRPGELLGMSYGHKTGHAARPDTDVFVSVPDGLDPMLGIYLAQMGPICANGVLHAAAELTGGRIAALGDGVRGRGVLVIGAGVVGLLTALFAAEHGAAEVAVADVSARRLAAAERLGLTAIDQRAGPAWLFCKDRWRDGDGCGADVAFQCRAQAASLHAALQALRPQGTVIDLAFYQGGASELRLGEDFHHNGLTIRCAQIGRVPRGATREWDRRRLAAETAELLRRRGADVRDALITDVVPLAQAPRLLAEVGGREREVIQAVFEP
jgi:threonine dehydrogenase-like Zn-dependent dehydrogenase